MGRPDALGTSFQIKSLDDADLALAELSWLENQREILTARTKQKVDAIKTEVGASAILEIDGQKVLIGDRIEVLALALEKFVIKNIDKHLVDGKKSIDLAHGTLGMRQQPLGVSIPEGAKEAVIVERIDAATFGLVGKMRAFLFRTIKALKSQLDQLITIKVSPNLTAIKAGLADKRLTKAQVESMGLIVREPFDAPVVTPAKCTTSTE